MSSVSAAESRKSLAERRQKLLLRKREELQQRILKMRLWRKGRLSWKLKPEQKEVLLQLRNPHIQLAYIDWTRRGGKSFVAITYSSEECLRFPNTHIRYCAAFLTDVEEFILPAFDKIFADCPADIKPTWLASKKRFVFKNGSTIKLVGLDKNPDGIRGNEVTIIVLDEAGFVAKLKYIYQSIIIPATARMKKIKVIIITTPPKEAREHFAYELRLKAETQENGFYLKKTIDDLTDMPESEKQRLFDEMGGKDSVTVQRELFCVWRVEEGRALVPRYNAEIHVREFEKPANANWLLAGDAGGKVDLTGSLSMAYSHDTGLIYIWDEYHADNKTPSAIWSEGMKAIREPGAPAYIDMDEQLRIDLSSVGFHTQRPMKQEFHTGLTFIRNIFYLNQIVVHPRCKLFIRTVEGGMLNAKATDYVRTEALGHCDMFATAIYGVRHVDKTTDKRPQISEKDAIVVPEKSKFESVVSSAFNRF